MSVLSPEALQTAKKIAADAPPLSVAQRALLQSLLSPRSSAIGDSDEAA